MRKQHKIKKLNIVFILIILLSVNMVSAEEQKKDATFELPEETIMGRGKAQKKNDGKEETQIEEKFGLEKSTSDKMLPKFFFKGKN